LFGRIILEDVERLDRGREIGDGGSTLRVLTGDGRCFAPDG